MGDGELGLLGRRGTGSNRGLRQREPLSGIFGSEAARGRRTFNLRVVRHRLHSRDDIVSNSDSGSNAVYDRASVIRPVENIVRLVRQRPSLKAPNFCDGPSASNMFARLGDDVPVSALEATVARPEL